MQIILVDFVMKTISVTAYGEARYGLIISQNKSVYILPEHNIHLVINAAALPDIGNSGNGDTPVIVAALHTP